jgi:sensor histidine kinase YesM
MCQSTLTMRRRIFDAFFSNFFSRDFLSLILTRHRKNKKKIFNFSIYLENYLLLRDKTKKRFFDENENLHLKLLVCNDLFDESIIFFFFFFLFFFFSSFFFFSLFIFIFFLFLFLFSREFELSTFFERVRLEASTRFFLLTKERKSIMMSKRKRLKKRIEAS